MEFKQLTRKPQFVISHLFLVVSFCSDTIKRFETGDRRNFVRVTNMQFSHNYDEVKKAHFFLF